MYSTPHACMRALLSVPGAALPPPHIRPCRTLLLPPHAAALQAKGSQLANKGRSVATKNAKQAGRGVLLAFCLRGREGAREGGASTTALWCLWFSNSFKTAQGCVWML